MFSAGIVKRLADVLSLFPDVDADALSGRVRELLSFRGEANHVLRVTPAVIDGKRVESKKFLSALQLLPGLLEGHIDEAVWREYLHATVMVQRLYASVAQGAMTAADVARVRREAIACVRALREYDGLSRMIKLHLLLHIAKLIPVCGPPRLLDESSLEGFHREIKRLHNRTQPGPRRRVDMLAWSAHHALVTFMLDVAGARERMGPAPAAAAVASAAATPAVPSRRSLVGSLSGSLAARPSRTRVALSRTVAGLETLGGFISMALIDGGRVARLTGGTRLAGTRVHGPGGAVLGAESPLLARFAPLLAREVLLACGVASDPPLTAGAREQWRRDVVNLTTINPSWRGEQLVAAHFSRAGALLHGGAVLLCVGARLRCYDALRFFSAGGELDAPALRVGRRPFVSFRNVAGNPTAAPGGEYCVGRLAAIISVPGSSTFRPASAAAPAEPEQRLVLLRSMRLDEDANGALVRDVPAAEGRFEPWEDTPALADEWRHHVAVPVDLVVRGEHVQPRYGPDADDVLASAWWRHPQGGLHGRVAPPSDFPLDDGAGALSEDDADEEEGAAPPSDSDGDSARSPLEPADDAADAAESDDEEDGDGDDPCGECAEPMGSARMVGCDRCRGWFHFACVGLTAEPTTAAYLCPSCREL